MSRRSRVCQVSQFLALLFSVVGFLGLRAEGGEVVLCAGVLRRVRRVLARVVDGMKPSPKGVPGGVPWSAGSRSTSIPEAPEEVPACSPAGR